MPTSIQTCSGLKVTVCVRQWFHTALIASSVTCTGWTRQSPSLDSVPGCASRSVCVIISVSVLIRVGGSFELPPAFSSARAADHVC